MQLDDWRSRAIVASVTKKKRVFVVVAAGGSKGAV